MNDAADHIQASARAAIGWGRVWEEDCNEEVPLMTELLFWLKANMPPIDRLSLTHNDFRSGNFLFDEKTQAITAWLDWELAHLGDRHQELGFFAVENNGPHERGWLASAGARTVADRSDARSLRE